MWQEMTKSIRIKNYLYEQIERLASENRRSLVTQLEILLEQALHMNGNAPLSDGGRKQDVQDPSGRVSPQPPSESVVRRPLPDRSFKPDPSFKPDFKPTKQPKKKGR